MHSSVQLNGAKNLSFLLKTSALVIAIAVSEGGALAEQNWSSQPSWASTAGESAPARRPSAAVKHDRYGLSPFAPGTNNLALDVGQVFLMGDLSAKYADNIGSQLHYTYGVSDMFGFDASLGYSSHSNSNADAKYSVATLLTGVRTNLSWYDKVVPHLVFGLGFYRPSIQQDNTSTSPVVFGLHLGPGVDLALTQQIFFGAALTFHDIFGKTEVTDRGKIDFSGTYTSFFLRAGVAF